MQPQQYNSKTLNSKIKVKVKEKIMENAKISKIKKSASVMATVLNVFRVFFIVIFILTAISSIILFMSKGKTGGSVLYENGQVRILSPISEGDYVEGNGFEFINSLGIDDVAVWGGLNCLAAAALSAVLAVLMNIIRKVFVEIKESDTPFTESIQKRLKISAIMVTILSLFSGSLGITAIIALSFWCVYCIFGYGIELQKNEDETL